MGAVLIWIGATSPCAGSSYLDTDALFSDEGFLVEAEELENGLVRSAVDGRSIDLSGSLDGKGRYTTKRDDYMLKTIFDDFVALLPDEIRELYQGDIDAFKETYHIGEDDWVTSTMTANLLVDIRLENHVRGFMNLDTIYYPYGPSAYDPAGAGPATTPDRDDEKKTDPILKELFLDANIGKKVFFRGGKQVLHWGRGFFFNPTDLINIEKKRFLDMEANREGTYGLKAHIPFGIRYNIYGFLDLGSEGTTDNFAYAGKFEFLLDKTEISVSSWKKKGVDPVFGLDVSTRLGTVDLIGELSLTAKETVFRANNDLTLTATDDTWVPRASLGLMKSFDFREVTDRITLAAELYYNHAGYSENIFDDPAKVLTLFVNDLYIPYNHSVYYAIFFAEYKSFFVSDLSLCLSGLGNVTDHSGIAMAQLKYTPLNDFTLECSLASTLGDGESEYTFTGDEISLEVVAKIFF